MRFTYASGTRPLDGYTIKRGIGVGGFGEVYFAISDAGKEVAAKRIQRNLDIELRGVRQCLNMKHVNLISLWDIRVTDFGETWVVMEYVPGYSLRDLLARHPQGLPEDQVRMWITSIAAGVSYLHARGIVHRDLKPGNVFFDSDSNVVKIGDYGLSKFISGSRRSGNTESVGTFHYMAPEIGRGSYGKEIDIYAIGVMFYELLCGHPPFDGETTHEIIMKHLTAEPDVTRIPLPYRRVIERCLRKDPAERYSDVSHMLMDTPWRPQSGEAVLAAAPWPDIEIASGAASPHVPTQWQPDPVAPVVAEVAGPVVIDERAAAEAEDAVERIRLRLDQGWQNHGGPSNVPQLAVPIHQDSLRASSIPREPIARFVYHSAHGLADWWHSLDWTTPWKVVLLVVIAITIIGNSTWILPSVLALGVLYAIYFGIRALIVKDAPAMPRTVYRPRATEEDFQHMVAQRLAARDWTEQAAEIAGSLLKGAIACAAFCALFLSIRGFSLGPEVVAVGVWAAIASTLMTWTVLLVTRLWSWQPGEWLFRMLVMGAAGAGLGLALYLAITRLVPEPQVFAVDRWSIGRSLNWASPQLASRFIVAVGVLFGVLRWWRLADPWRRNRIVIWRVAFGIGLAIGAGYAFGFESWLPWVFGVSIVATQLAAPWYYLEVKKMRYQHKLAARRGAL